MSRQSKVYSGNRSRFTTLAEVSERGATLAQRLELHLDLFNHSPTRLGSGAIGAGDPR